MSEEAKISYRSPLQWRPEDGQAVPDDTIVRFALAGGAIEVRHKGDWIEVHACADHGRINFMIQPVVGNEIALRLTRP